MFPFIVPYLTQRESDEVILEISEIELNLPLPGISDKHHMWELKVKQSPYRPGVAQKVPGS